MNEAEAKAFILSPFVMLRKGQNNTRSNVSLFSTFHKTHKSQTAHLQFLTQAFYLQFVLYPKLAPTTVVISLIHYYSFNQSSFHDLY